MCLRPWVDARHGVDGERSPENNIWCCSALVHSAPAHSIICSSTHDLRCATCLKTNNHKQKLDGGNNKTHKALLYPSVFQNQVVHWDSCQETLSLARSTTRSLQVADHFSTPELRHSGSRIYLGSWIHLAESVPCQLPQSGIWKPLALAWAFAQWGADYPPWLFWL